MGETSIRAARGLSLPLKGILTGMSAIALILCISPGQAAESQRRSIITSSKQANLKQSAPSEGSAEDLKLSPASVLQESDLSDLPVLEPSVPFDQPVSVPPIAPLETPASPTTSGSTPAAVAEVQAPEIPLEPPFIGDLAQTAASETTSTETLADSSPPSAPSVVADSAATDSTAASTQSVRPANVSRWPDPIPFGQPLPDD